MGVVNYIIIGLIVFFTILFIVCAIVFPELVGIAGRRAKEIEERHHRGDEFEDNTAVSESNEDDDSVNAKQ